MINVDVVDYHQQNGRNMTMKNPSHPGLLVKHECLETLGLTITAGAEVLGVTRKTLSELVNIRAGISPEMSVRLAKAFGSTARAWLDMQTSYDLARIDTTQIKLNLMCQKQDRQAGSLSLSSVRLENELPL